MKCRFIKLEDGRTMIVDEIEIEVIEVDGNEKGY